MSDTISWLESTASSGTVPPRARTDAVSVDLGGVWDFRYRSRAVDEANGDWGTIQVPGCWQLQGHGVPIYLSAQYPIPLDPPHVPDENPVGEYRRRFDAPADFLVGAVLRFDGIDSTGRIWLNGVHLGWTRGSRLTQEFDVTAILREHGNELVVHVAQWSAGTYVEDQDMWWLSGIVRDVALVRRPPGTPSDVHVQADLDPDTGHGLLTVAAGRGASGQLDGIGLVAADGTPHDVGPVDAWTAETPRLYGLEVSTPGGTVRLRVGFRRVEIRDGLLRVNGTPIRFRGVNRHDHDPVTGRTVTPQSVRADLEMMKAHGINAVRTSHYPPTPYLLDVADDIGLWVIEENDIETHGFVLADYRRNPVDDPAWTFALLERTRRMVVRDRNHPSVIVWSLGNEAGPGRCLQACRDLIAEIDPTRPVHYERDRGYAYSDIFSLMYTPVDRVEEIGRGLRHPSDPATDGPLDKPFLLCEYGHAMGAGPGGLSEYEALFDAYPRLQGGFIWEWCDHTLAIPGREGRPDQGYGGDFGEPLHDGSFAADGLVAADRTPRPGLADYAAVIAPLRIEVGEDVVAVRNRFDTLSTSAVEVTWTAQTHGVSIASGVLDLPPIPPGGTGQVAVRWPPAAEVILVEAMAGPWPAGRGHLARVRPVALPDAVRAAPETWPVTFTSTGRLASLGGVTIDGPSLGLWRAPTDNDRGLNMIALGQDPDAADWERDNLRVLSERTVSWSRDEESARRVIRTHGWGRDLGVQTSMIWRPTATGVLLDADSVPVGPWSRTWARIGWDLVVPGTGASSVRWQGDGPGPGGPDTGQANRPGWFESTVADWQVDYARPQDQGARTSVSRLEVGLDGGRVLVIDSAVPVSVTVRPWSDQQLADARHGSDLVETGRLFVCLDAFRHGYGTGACGPGVLPQYRLTPRPASWRVHLAVE